LKILRPPAAPRAHVRAEKARRGDFRVEIDDLLGAIGGDKKL